MAQNKISILIPVFNSPPYLRESVLSLLKDPHPEKEILIIDDGSSASPKKLVGDLPVRFIESEINHGPAHALNLGLREATGDFVAFMDQDDILAPGGISWRWQWLHTHPATQAVMGGLAGVIDQRSERISTYRMLLKRKILSLPETLTLNFFRQGGWVPLSPLSLCLFRRELLSEVGFFDESLRAAHDREYLYRILHKTRIPHVPRSVLFYRLHESNLSVKIERGKIIPKRRTVAELFLINLAHGIPFPQA